MLYLLNYTILHNLGLPNNELLNDTTTHKIQYRQPLLLKGVVRKPKQQLSTVGKELLSTRTQMWTQLPLSHSQLTEPLWEKSPIWS